MSADAIRDSLERDPRDSQDADIIVITWGPENTDYALEALRRFWATFTVFGVDGYGRWVALRRDGRAALIGDSPDSLATAIRDDCAPEQGRPGERPAGRPCPHPLRRARTSSPPHSPGGGVRR